MKLPQNWTNHKKFPTNPDKKEAHQNRKSKMVLIHYVEEQDWQQQLKEYNNNAYKQIQE
jgi:phenylpyruvate tautomerase PptA (4-oxalocrotonate tautomerase family)